MNKAEILHANTDKGYGEEIVHLSAEGRDVIVISDLHLASGRDRSGKYAGTENFFADDSFERFLAGFIPLADDRKRLLVINGDFIDFLRVTDVPHGNEFGTWVNELHSVGIHKTVAELEASILKKERQYGLQTNDYKSIWKLYCVWNGHRKVFSALADWLRNGNGLIITKGNHDLEWYYPKMREYFLELVSRDGVDRMSDVTFIDHAVVLDSTFYIEHGHRYDKFSTVVGEAVWNTTGELNIPFGSFFNRYLINTIELRYPYLDNIKPAENLLPMLIRERLPLAMKIFGSQIWFLLKMVRKRYWNLMFAKTFALFGALILPIGFVVYLLIRTGFFSNFTALEVPSTLSSTLTSVGGMVASYFLMRIVAWLGLQEPTSLDKFAEEHFKKHPEHDIVTYGHTHHAGMFTLEGGKHFFNTGTWIPIIETTSAEVSYDRTFVYLYVSTDGVKFVPNALLRWNDDAGRADPIRLIKKKE